MPVVCLLAAASALANTYTVINTNDSGGGSLRQAILDANGNAGADTIAFNIPGPGVHTITPLTALPQMNEPTVVDGYTQPGSSANTLATGDNAVILIELNGVTVGGGNGLQFGPVSGGSVVQGLAVYDFFIGIASQAPNTVQGCFIGTDASGTMANANTYGIFDAGGTMLIGGALPAQRNLISGNINGIHLGDNSVVLGNYIGTNPAGTAALGNQIGIRLTDCSNATIGGPAGSSNLISGQTAAFKSAGIFIEGDSNNNTIIGNLIGTDTSSLAGIPNRYGIYMQDSTGNSPKNNSIGTNLSVNAISFNQNAGVAIASTAAAATGNSIRFNTMVNDGVTIDLGDNGATANDAQDPDAGPNELQNYPVITSATVSGPNVTVNGTLNSTPLTTFDVQIFRNAVGTCGARTLQATLNVTTDAAGDATFNTSFPGTFGGTISATATNPANSTSEVSPCTLITSATQPDITIDDVPQAEGNSGTTQFTFTISLSAPYASTVSVDYATADGSANAGSDYTTKTGTATFTPGQTAISFDVDVAGDTALEGDETFLVNLTNAVNGTITDAQGTGTIQNDDSAVDANVSLTKTGPSSAVAGANITYTLTASNAGPGAATNVVITDPLPAGTAYVTSTTTQGTCGAFLSTVTCALGTLSSGATATVTLTLTTPSSPGSITNTATIVAAENDPVAANNTGTATTTISAPQAADVPTLDVRALLALIALLAVVALFRSAVA
jgi:uncharacterized repeat protein (TIGR01451 family)